MHPHVEAGPDGGIVTSTRQTGLYRKEVMTKQHPETLIAKDATICRVSTERFGTTKVGDSVYCNWQ